MKMISSTVVLLLFCLAFMVDRHSALALSGSGIPSKGGSYLNQLSQTQTQSQTPQQTVIGVNGAVQSQPAKNENAERTPVAPYARPKISTPFSVPTNADGVLGYQPRQRHPAMQQPQQSYARPDDFRHENRRSNDLYRSNNNYASYRNDGFNRYNNNGRTSYASPFYDNTIQLEGKQFYRYRPNQGYNNYNGYHYQDNFGSRSPYQSYYNEYNNPFNSLYYRNNYNQYNGYNNIDYSGAKYYYDKSTGRQYQNYEYNNHVHPRPRRQATSTTTGAPKYYRNKSTGEQYPNPEYRNTNSHLSYYYNGHNHHTRRQGSINGVMRGY